MDDTIEQYGSSNTNFQPDKVWQKRTKHMIALVDDEEPIRLAVGDYLFQKGYQVTACADADALLELVSDHREKLPDVIVSDIRMPGGMDGIELLGRLQAEERLARIPVVLLTAKGLAQDRVQGYRAGAYAYLSKPFDPEELLSIVDNVIVRNEQMTCSESGENKAMASIKNDLAVIKDILKEREKKVLKAAEVNVTPMEKEVLGLLCDGLSNNEIAEFRGIGTVGVQRAVSNLFLKTQTKTRTELVRWAMQRGYNLDSNVDDDS
eukprot:CAMPEP_0196819912 /NCGR_PEP_ID=MMETSP1362-20130617/72868_1 /TAXON_ID=163516 /ORGANISM="Leptocylindrus danicus, Strain CCMP1856" /LENGTH=263 /DNA_ID=CAMNT_0042198575 /DNA_START=169 /DNA_END=960 /DNA_ORIENTATION=-